MSQNNTCRFYFYDNFGKRGPIFITFSLLNSERICRKSRNENYHLPTNLLPHYLVKCKWSTIQLYIHIGKNASCVMYCCCMRHVIRHLCHEYLFIYFFFLILTSLWHYCSILFVALLIPFSYEDKMFGGTPLNNAQLTHPLTSGIHESKHAYVLKVDISNTWRILARVEKQRNSIPHEHLQ